MVERLIKDESGIAMGLAIILVVVVGVMGAGLLVFVRNDLEAVVQVNQGQRAFESADAGVQAAKRQLEINQEDLGEWASGDGVEIGRLYDDSTVSVQIEEESEDRYAVTSTGRYREATRRIEAVFNVESQADAGVPPGLQDIQTDGNFEVNGSSEIENAMVYAEGETLIESSLSLSNSSLYSNGYFYVNPTLDLQDSSVFVEGEFNNNNGYADLTVQGEDPFGDWYNLPYNSTPREVSESGIGATGEIIRDPDNPGIADLPGYNDGSPQQHYDSTTSPAFGEGITYPFDTEALASREPDIESLREVAQSQSSFAGEDDNYIEIGESEGINEVAIGNNGNEGDLGLAWPEDTTPGTVIFISFKGGTDNLVKWAERASCDSTNSREAVLVVENANLGWDAGAPFRGAIVTVGGNVDTQGDTGEVSVGGQLCTSGPIYADGDIDIDGSGANTGSLTPEEFEQLPPGIPGAGRSVTLESWRELYE